MSNKDINKINKVNKNIVATEYGVPKLLKVIYSYKIKLLKAQKILLQKESVFYIEDHSTYTLTHTYIHIQTLTQQTATPNTYRKLSRP